MSLLWLNKIIKYSNTVDERNVSFTITTTEPDYKNELNALIKRHTSYKTLITSVSPLRISRLAQAKINY